ncbi:MAG: dihydrofolate reductase family protein [Acidimicrobiales bacterium]|nr:dihydrofolate reductase family protein [Acidimicrobiales bacterium]
MTRFRYYTASTLDGFIADPHDSLDWLFEQKHDADGPLNYDDFAAEIGALAMGATTYGWIVDHMAETGEAWSYDQPTFVFTHRRPEPIVDTVTFVSGDPGEHRETLLNAAGHRDVWVVGGGGLAGQFAAASMLDEMIVSYAPVTLGAGRPLFGLACDFELVEHGRNGAFLVSRHRVVGPRQPTPVLT